MGWQQGLLLPPALITGRIVSDRRPQVETGDWGLKVRAEGQDDGKEGRIWSQKYLLINNGKREDFFKGFDVLLGVVFGHGYKKKGMKCGFFLKYFLCDQHTEMLEC